jgi:hypothetical protein
VSFKIGTGETKSDREWLKKKKDFLEKLWKKNGTKLLRKIQCSCGDSFTNTAKQSGILVLLNKKSPQDSAGILREDNPLEIHISLNKTDTIPFMRDLLIRMLTHSFIEQMYEFHFRIREQTLFEDILSDECLTSIVSLMVSGKKLSRANCTKALDQAIAETIFRLSQKATRERLVDTIYDFFQEYPDKIKNHEVDIIENREQLIERLLKFLPKNISGD